jgi:hypothetical protein
MSIIGITSGTLATELLIIRGANGLIYEINAESGGLSAQELTDPKYREKLNGSVIVQSCSQKRKKAVSRMAPP